MPIAALRASRVVEKNELGWRSAKSENHRAAALELHLMSNVDELPPLSRNVLGYRLHQRLSQQDLADRCRVSRATVAKIERGHVPTLRTIKTLAKALSTTPAKLLDDPAFHTTTTRFLEGLRAAVERASARTRRLIANLARRLTRLRKSSS